MSSYQLLIIAILGIKLMAGLGMLGFGNRIKGVSRYLALAASLSTMVLTTVMLTHLNGDDLRSLDLEYLPVFGIRLSLAVDWLSFPFLLTEEFVTLFAVIYAFHYSKDEENPHIFYGLLMLFASGMSGTTLANDIFLFYLFWELMLIASALLIFNWGHGENRSGITFKYFIITHLGSLLVLVGFVMIYTRTGVDYFSALDELMPSVQGILPMVSVLFLIGFCIKMAVVPFHIWLPDAHAVAPMPVTIMLAAAMLGMGTYGILRFPMSFISYELFSRFSLALMAAGVLSEAYGAVMALMEEDIKRIIAYSSVSQMGYILFGLGTMTQTGVMGATLHVIYHAIVKALLFCCVGIIIHATGERQIHRLGGLWHDLPYAGVFCMIGALSFAGLPALAIFNSEWLIISSGFQTPYTTLAVLEVLGSVLTAAYGLRFIGLIFFGQAKKRDLKPIPQSMWIATGGLAALTIIAGVLPRPIFDIVANELPLILGGMLP